MFHAFGVGAVLAADDEIDAVLVETKSGRFAVRGEIFIDGSGDGDLAAWTGVPYEVGDGVSNMLYPSTMFRINGVDPDKAGRAWELIPTLMDEAEKQGRRFPRKKPIVRPQRNPIEWRANLTQIKNPDGSAVSGIDARQLSYGEVEGRRQCWDVFQFIKGVTPGFEHAYIVEIAPQIGIRETRRIAGEYQLTEKDILGCADFSDSIGVQGWPVEAHVKGDVKFVFAPPDFARLQPDPVSNHRAAEDRQLVRRRPLRIDVARRPVVGARLGAVLHHGPSRGHGGRSRAWRQGRAARGRRARAAATPRRRRREPRAGLGCARADEQVRRAMSAPRRKLRSNLEPGTALWAGRRAQWRALGLSDEDMVKPKIAIINSSSELSSCFSHLDGISAELKVAIRAAGGLPFEVRTAAPSDFITSAGRRGAYILSARDLIAADIEVQVEGALLDGMVGLASCDKTTPGQLMAAGRLNIPTIVVVCGYQRSGEYKGEHVDIEEVFLKSGYVASGRVTRRGSHRHGRRRGARPRRLRRHGHRELDAHRLRGARHGAAGQRAGRGAELEDARPPAAGGRADRRHGVAGLQAARNHHGGLGAQRGLRRARA